MVDRFYDALLTLTHKYKTYLDISTITSIHDAKRSIPAADRQPAKIFDLYVVA